MREVDDDSRFIHLAYDGVPSGVKHGVRGIGLNIAI